MTTFNNTAKWLIYAFLLISVTLIIQTQFKVCVNA